MALFRYTGFKDDGKPVSGEIEADAQDLARRKLLTDGIMVTALKNAEKRKLAQFNMNDLRHASLKQLLQTDIGPAKVPHKDLVAFTRQFATMVEARIPLVDALDALAQQSENATLARTLKKVKTSVNEGQTLAQALDQFPNIFNELYRNMVLAAEASGKLGDILSELADTLEERQALTGQLRAALTYPAMMLVVGFGLIIFMLVSVVPQITSMFDDLGHNLPPATVLMLSISNFLQVYGLELFLFLFVSFVGLRRLVQTSAKARLVWHKVLLAMPIVGPFMHKAARARFCAAMAALAQAGVPLLNAIKISRRIVPLLPYRYALDEVMIKVGEGTGLAPALKASHLFPPLIINMIGVGEKTGQLGPMLARVSTSLSNELQIALKGLTSLIQPVLLLLMGGMIAFIMMAVLLPIFELNTFAGG